LLIELPTIAESVKETALVASDECFVFHASNIALFRRRRKGVNRTSEVVEPALWLTPFW
jgi:hypothetical protein